MQHIRHAVVALFRRRRPRRSLAGEGYPPFGGPALWQERWPTETDPAPAACREHAQALELCHRLLRLEAAANALDSAGPRWLRVPVRDHDAQLAAANQALTEHLVRHRAVLGSYPHWANYYTLIDS